MASVKRIYGRKEWDAYAHYWLLWIKTNSRSGVQSSCVLPCISTSLSYIIAGVTLAQTRRWAAIVACNERAVVSQENEELHIV